MRIVIIEDEIEAALDLQHSIHNLNPDIETAAVIDSVETGLEWFSNNLQPDAIFSDIQLGDGLAFDIFRQHKVHCPVVFCTAFDQYAVQAFRNNGVDYLLKPIDDKLLQESLNKIDQFKKTTPSLLDPSLLEQLAREMAGNAKSYKSIFLVSFRDKIFPIGIADILFFRIIDDGIELSTINNATYRISETLDCIESSIDPRLFYRANRQYLVAFNAIQHVESYFDRRLLIELLHPAPEPVIVSKAKASDFLRWLENR
jgi:DNA-binding LytR/AlgR family response regulator